MMNEPSNGQRRWPWGLIVSLGMILMVERYFVRHDRSFTEIANINWRYAKQMSGSAAARTEILCLGSSQTKFGLLPRVIEAETGKGAFNLAVCGAAAPTSYFVLRRALENGARPQAIVFDCPASPFDRSQPDEVETYLLRNRRRWPELLDLRDTLDLSMEAHDATFFARTVTCRLLPSYKARFEVRAKILAKLRGDKSETRQVFHLFKRNWQANGGTCSYPRNLKLEAEYRGDVVMTEPQPEPSSYQVNPLHKAYTRRLLDLAAAHGIRVFFVVPPILATRQQLKNQTGEDQHLTRFVSGIQARYPNLVVIDARRAGFPVEAFMDEVHLNGAGAASLSTEVATVIRRTLSDPAPERLWVTLSEYHPLAADRPVLYEDISQSTLALRAESRATEQASARAEMRIK
jgi:hypothetical protein